ncbi:DUF262 domain-containing protein [Vagococcus jeotgali]|uniref:DUF262 domain-containing protein n=1 Tax=Vagococcus jeotgali TaxID=3109030 RepID=UPI002DDB596C|nr:DUF262 domain-containing HNH endonuclease family protein [Vagococcus sp. B2T-5]
MKADTVHFFKFLEQKNTIFNIPVYQRNYEWSTQQCKQLIKDIEKIIESDFMITHFLGTIVYVNDTGPQLSHYYNIIDGQQRITSFMLFLRAIASVTDDQLLRDEVIEDYLKNLRHSENDHLKLKSIEKDRIAFKAIMEDQVGQGSKLYENYEFFKKHITESEYTAQQFFDALSKVQIVYIELNGNDKGENPQVIFESINSTGLSLTSSDLIRNFLLMGMDYEAQTRLYHDYWVKIESRIPTNQISTFIRFFLTFNTSNVVTEGRVYQEYKRFFEENQLDSETAIQELTLYSLYYQWLNEEQIPNGNVNAHLKHINAMKATVVYPYLMKVLKYTDDGLYSWDETQLIFETIESYLFRRSVTDKKTNVLNKVFAALSRDVSQQNESERLIHELLSKSGNQVFPRDDEFIEALSRTDLYNRRNNIAKLTLMGIESLNNKENVEYDSIQIEHILPQELSNEWKVELKNAQMIQMKYLHTLGNLTLTGYNSELSNKTFAEKKMTYKDSNISMTRDLYQDYATWDEQSIISRAKKLSALATSIWVLPHTSESKEIVSLSGEHYLDEEVNITGSKPRALSILNREFKVDSWKKVLMIFLDFAWEKDSQTFEVLKRKQSLNRLFNSSDPKSPGKLSNGLTVETNFSAESMLSIVKIIAKEYEVYDDVSYVI